MNKSVVHPQAEKFIKSLAPEPRRRIARAIKALPEGDCKALEGRLAGYSRLRVGGYRIIYSDKVNKGIRTFDCLFVERRSIVYELFEQIMVERAMTGD
jgi:mRNA-degrading endonuclease RelE of RelBE toxin-antitoxin system